MVIDVCEVETDTERKMDRDVGGRGEDGGS
jgi:hypothetical protein